MQGWEYVTVYYKEAAEGGHGHKYPLIMANSPRITRQWKDLQLCLTEMGMHGWELAGVTPPLTLPGGETADYHASQFYLIFKRPYIQTSRPPGS